MYLGFQGLRGLTQVLPLSAVRAIGSALGWVAYRLLAGQRRLTLTHLDYALGSTTSPEQRQRIARRVFLNLGQTAMEWMRLPGLSAASLQKLVTVEGAEHMREALAQGHGVIGITAHFGNWELIPLCLRALGFESGVLARRLRYPEYESFLIKARAARGVATLERGSLKDVTKLLRANAVVGMLPDQDMDSLEGLFVEFFGHPAHTPSGPAALSLMTGAPIVPGFMIREGDRFRFIIEPALAAPEAADRTQAVAELTRAWSRVVESYIRRYPDQWVWMHRRWKTQPAEGAEGRRPQAERARPPLRVLGFRPAVKLVLAVLLVAYAGSHLAALRGRGRSPGAVKDAAATDDDQRMSAFTLTGYKPDGHKRWTLNGESASADGAVVTILRPDGIGYDAARTAYLRAGAAQMNQINRHVRMEHDVTVHTSDGLWLTAPVLHWLPDQNQVSTDTPVRIETDHMLLRGRGLDGFAQLKRAVIAEDVEMVLNPTDHEPGAAGPKQVVITCDGPLVFDYEHEIATFEQNVHVQDPTSGDLYSDKLIAYLDQKTRTIRYAEAIGRVRIHQDQNTALSERAIYQPAIGKVTLVGKPSLLVYPSPSNEPVQLSFGGLASGASGSGEPSTAKTR